MKTCRECGKRKRLSSFYKHPRMADGHLNKCKECVKARVADHRERNLDRIREYDRRRGQTEKRREKVRANYAKAMANPKKRAHMMMLSAARNEARKLERACYAITWHAIRKGTLKRPENCEKCGEPKPEAHHEDYNYPLDVMWLCKACHGKRHQEINDERRAS